MNATHLIILNRDGGVAATDGWIHVVPKGELPNRAAGVTQVLDEPALDAILANIAAEKQRLGEKWPGVYAGREHFIYNDDQDSAALAWFKVFEKRGDGIWANADGLTPIGKQVIANAEYKFTSFVADRRDTQKLDGNKVRILKLDTIGFTNQANGKELLTPITNRDGASRPPNFPGSREPGANQNPNQRTMTMKSIAQKLGLAPEASEDAILGEVTKLQNRLTKLEPFEAEVTTLKNRIKDVETSAIESEVAGLLAERKITDDKVVNRLKPVLANLKNREDRAAFLDDCGFKAEAAKTASSTRIINRADSRSAATATETDDAAKADKIRNRAHELKTTAPTRDWDSCWQQASREAAK